jgi:hypothetical protein
VTALPDNSLTWVGALQPTPLIETYRVRLRYQLEKRPRVTFVSPELSARNGCTVPHVFRAQALCLFRFKHCEWDSTMSLAKTIVPWTSLWLLHWPPNPPPLVYAGHLP